MSAVTIDYVQSRPCGTCQCFFRTAYVACNSGQADEIYDTLHYKDLGWAKTLDLRNLEGVLDTMFLY